MAMETGQTDPREVARLYRNAINDDPFQFWSLLSRGRYAKKDDVTKEKNNVPCSAAVAAACFDEATDQQVQYAALWAVQNSMVRNDESFPFQELLQRCEIPVYVNCALQCGREDIRSVVHYCWNVIRNSGICATELDAALSEFVECRVQCSIYGKLPAIFLEVFTWAKTVCCETNDVTQSDISLGHIGFVTTRRDKALAILVCVAIDHKMAEMTAACTEIPQSVRKIAAHVAECAVWPLACHRDGSVSV